MANHSIDSSKITDMTGATANDQDVIDTMVAELVTKHDASLHATTGHAHDATTGNGPSLSSGVGSLTIAELGKLFFAYGGIT